MHVKCPKCKAELDLTVEVLSAAEGLIRCGECDTAFNALALIPDDPKKAEAPKPSPARDASRDQPRPKPQTRKPAESTKVTSEPEAAREESDSPNERDKLPMADLFENAPETLPPGDGPPLQIGAEDEQARKHHWWVAATLAMVVLLGIQLVIASSGALARFSATRPIAEAVCSVMNCQVPQPRQPEAISLLDRDIRKHPSVEGGLMITATMSNQLGSAQPYPVVEIQLSDLDGRPVALRRFDPHEYLASETDISAGMPPEILVPMSFEVVDPGDRAVAFEFRFR